MIFTKASWASFVGTGPPFWGSAIPGVRVRVRVRVNPSRPPEWRTGISFVCFQCFCHLDIVVQLSVPVQVITGKTPSLKLPQLSMESGDVTVTCTGTDN